MQNHVTKVRLQFGLLCVVGDVLCWISVDILFVLCISLLRVCRAHSAYNLCVHWKSKLLFLNIKIWWRDAPSEMRCIYYIRSDFNKFGTFEFHPNLLQIYWSLDVNATRHSVSLWADKFLFKLKNRRHPFIDRQNINSSSLNSLIANVLELQSLNYHIASRHKLLLFIAHSPTLRWMVHKYVILESKHFYIFFPVSDESLCF